MEVYSYFSARKTERRTRTGVHTVHKWCSRCPYFPLVYSYVLSCYFDACAVIVILPRTGRRSEFRRTCLDDVDTMERSADLLFPYIVSFVFVSALRIGCVATLEEPVASLRRFLTSATRVFMFPATTALIVLTFASILARNVVPKFRAPLAG